MLQRRIKPTSKSRRAKMHSLVRLTNPSIRTGLLVKIANREGGKL
jgi:hypothetical protein